MKTLRFALLFCALALPFSALPAFAQNVTGSLSTILDEEPSGSGWSSVVSDAQAQCTGNGHPYYHSTVVENQTFEGDFTPSRRMALAVFSDDGSDVTVNGTKIFPAPGQTAGGKGQGQTLDSNALHKVNITLEAGTTHHIKVDYSNTYYTGSGDTDGCTLFAYEKTSPYISLNTAQSPMTATYSSPNGVDPKNVKFIFDGTDQTANTSPTGSSLSYTLPSGVSFFASHSVEVDVTDNDGNLGVAAVSAHTLMPEDPFVDTSTNTTVSYNLAGPQQVRVRVCLYGTDTATKTFAASAQSAGKQSVTWDGMDDNGGLPQTGVYVFKVEKQSGSSWVDLADIDPIRGRTVNLNIDGARLSDTNTNSNATPGGTERATQYPVKIWGTLTGSWTMVPLQLVGTTLLGTVAINGQNNSTLDGYFYNDPRNVRTGGPPAPDYVPGSSALYWYIKDVTQIRSLGTNAAGQTMPYKLGASASLGVVNGTPIVSITTGITGATVSQRTGQMAYRGVNNGSNLMAYSFDDGPYNNANSSTQNGQSSADDQAFTQDLLDVLSPYGCKVTFFTNGTKIRAINDADTDTLWNMVSLGHEIANHTYNHISNINETYYADGIRSELLRGRFMERWVIGVKHGSSGGQSSIPYFRPPGGAGVGYNDRHIIDQNFDGDASGPGHYNDPYFWATIGEVGYMTIAWGPSPADPGETPGKTVSQQATSITNYLEAPKGLVSGNIVLLHNGRKHTVLALQQVLPYLQKNGWSLGKVSDVQPIPADPNVSASNP